MSTLRDIKRRIESVKSTQQITSAMKMISAAKLSRAQNASKQAEPYSEQLLEMVSRLADNSSNPLFKEHNQGHDVVMLLTSDKGLCGGFNANLCKMLLDELGGDTELIIFGRTGNDFFRHRPFNIASKHTHLQENERRQQLSETMQDLLGRFLQKSVKRVLLAYNHFENPLVQTPVLRQVIPVVAPEGIRDEREIIFEPDEVSVLHSLLAEYVDNLVLSAHLQTEAGEHGARMVAMEGATKNASDMIDRLTLNYNRLRQAMITSELIEIINGAQSL